MKTLVLFTALFVSSRAIASNVERFYFPDEKQPACVATLTQLAKHPAAWAAVGTFGGIEYVVGTWELTGIPFKSQTISFSQTPQGFFVQNADDAPAQASLCAVKNTDNEISIRVSIHKAACPERKNFYVRTKGMNEMSVASYASRFLGSVTFKRVSPIPQPPGNRKGQKNCAGDDQEEQK